MRNGFVAGEWTVTPPRNLLVRGEEQYLQYTIQPAGADAAVVTLAWEKRAIAFRIRVSS